jgi:hypothetical protein
MERRRAEFGIAIEFLCYCGTMKRMVVSPHTGAVLSRQYMYPEGYHTEFTPKAEFRAAFLTERPRRKIKKDV